MTVNDIMQKILPDKPFFKTSGGGVTLSGGEPTLFMDFTSQLLQSLRQHSIHTLLETCGYFDLDMFMDMLYPHLDAIYFDIKIIDRVAHKKYCGRSNDKILDNFRRITRKAKNDNKVLLPRIPLVPDMTDTEANVKAIAAFLKSVDVAKASLLAYNPLWHEKSDKIGLIGTAVESPMVDDPCKKSKSMTSFGNKGVLERCRAILMEAGISEING
jgi:pyruvate formate lyase activating enzyme